MRVREGEEVKADAVQNEAFQTKCGDKTCRCLNGCSFSRSSKPMGSLLLQPTNLVCGPLIRDPLISQSHFWLPNTFTTLPGTAAAIIIIITIFITPL